MSLSRINNRTRYKMRFVQARAAVAEALPKSARETIFIILLHEFRLQPVLRAYTFLLLCSYVRNNITPALVVIFQKFNKIPVRQSTIFVI